MLQARSAEEREYEEILLMVQEAFRKAAGGRSTGEFERNIVEATVNSDPNFCKGDLRIVEADGEIVSMMLVVRRQVRIGMSTVRNAIVSPVATRVGHEKKGHCSAVMRDAVAYMKQERFDFTTLWGHPWLYTRYGYSPAMVRPSVAIKPERCRPTEVEGKFTIQPYEETQARAVTDIYHENTVDQVLAEIRNPEPFEWKVNSPNVEFQTVLDEKGKVAGYYSLSQTATQDVNLLEIGVANTEACGIVFNKLLNFVKEKKLPELACPMGPQHPFAQFAYWRNAELRTTIASGAGFVQILDVTSFFSKIREELENRLNHSKFYNKTLTLVLKEGEESVDLLIDDGEITVSSGEEKADCILEAPLSSLNGLVTGYKNICELVEREEAMIRSDSAVAEELNCMQLVDVLFPKSAPYGSILPLFWE